MADNDHDLDDFDLEDELDLPEFDDTGLEGPSNDRNPVERVAGGFLEGVKNTSMDRRFQRQLISRALPEGYGKAFDDVDEAVNLGQDLYDTAASALRPYEKTIKKIGRRVTEKAERFLPEGLSTKLKELTEPEVTDTTRPTDYREAEVTTGLAEIFGAKAEADAEEKADDVTRENVREVVDERRHQTKLDLLKTMRSGMDRMVAYQDRVTASYQRKSLELQFRQLFVSRDQYTLMEAHVKENKLQLQAIAKNTALPEFVKLRSSEAVKQMLRQRAVGGVLDQVGKSTGSFMDTIRDKGTAKVKQFVGSIGEGLQGVNDAMEMTEGAGVNVDSANLGGQIGAGLVMEDGVTRYGRKLGNVLGKVPGVARMGDRLEYMSDNKDDMLRAMLDRMVAKDDGGLGSDFDLLTEEEQAKRREELEGRSVIEKARDMIDRGTGGLQASLARTILDALGPAGSADRRFSEGDASNLATEIAPYTSMTDRAITEIIPGLLTNILHEAEMIRTGDDTIDRRIYDPNARTFRREDNVQKDLMQTVMPDDRKQAIRDDIDAIVADLDPNEALSSDARQSMKRQILEDFAAGKKFRPDRYTDREKLIETHGEESATQIAALMHNNFNDEEGNFRSNDNAVQALRNKVSKKFDQGASALPNYQEAIGKIYATYGPETLRDMGLMQSVGAGDNSLDTKGILDNFIQGSDLTSRGLESRTLASVDTNVVREPDDPRSMVWNTGPLPDESSGADLGRIESSLSTMQSMLGRFVEVATGRSYEEQFKNVLKAIGELNVKEHFDLSNDWLEKIYNKLVECCGGGGPTPPAGGPPSGPGEGPDSGPTEPSPVRAWRDSNGAPIYWPAPPMPRSDMSSAESTPPIQGPDESWWRRGQDRVRQGMGRTRDRLSSLTQGERVQSGVDRLKSLEMPDVDLRGAVGRGYDTLTSNVVDYTQKARGATQDLAGRVMESDRGQRAAATMDRVRDEVRGRLPTSSEGESTQPIQETVRNLQTFIENITHATQPSITNVTNDARTQYDQTVERVKPGVESITKEVRNRAGDVVNNVRNRYEASDVEQLKDQLVEALSQSGEKTTVIKDRLNNLVNLDDWRLTEQPMAMDDRESDVLPATGSGLPELRSNIQSRFSGEGPMRSQFDRAYGSVTGGINDVRDRIMDSDFDLTGYLSDEAANDPRKMLAALQKVSEETLAKLEEVSVGEKVQTLTSEITSGTRSVLSLLKEKIDNVRYPTSQPNVVTEDAPGAPSSSAGTGDFWTQAWDMLTNLKGHMDDKTAQLIEAMGNLSIAGGDGEPGMFKKMAGKVGEGVGGIASYYGKSFRAMGNLVGGAGKGGGSILKGIGSRVGSMIRGKGQDQQPIVDIYMEGQTDPVLLARDLRKGKYISRESGEEVTRIDDIDGAVLDERGKTVVTDEDVAEGKLYTQRGKEVKPSVMSKIGKGYLNYTTMPARALFTGAKKVGDYLVNKAKEPQDVYVKGEEHPRLLAVVMKNGGYLSKATQKPIMSPQDIDGDVINHEGQTRLTEAEIANPGIVNARGKAIRDVGSGLSEIAKAAGGMLGSYYKGVWNAGKSVVGGIGNMLGLGEGKEGSGGGMFGGGGKKQVEWLEKIYALLDERIEPPKKTREGSWKQLMGEDDEEAVDPNDPRGIADPKKGVGGGLLGMIGGALGGLFDKLNPFSGDGGGVGVDLPLGREGRDRERGRDRKARTRGGKKGLLGKLWSGAKSVGRGALNVGKAALPIAGSALALGGKALAATAGAVGSVVSAPVLLTGAAIAAVGVGGYMLYKNFANDPEGPLHRFRLMQYGIDPDSGDPVARINALEDKLEDEVNLGGGQPTINEGVDAKELLEICGIDEEDREAVHNWANWFQMRFKPVFLSHISVLNSLDSNLSLSDVDDDLDETLKTTYLKRVHFKEGSDAPYRATSYLPFDDIESLAGPTEVQAEYDKAMDKVAREKAQKESGPASRSKSDPSRPGPVRAPIADPKPESAPSDIPDIKPKTEKERLNAGVDRRKKDSPTAQDIGPMDKETYARLSASPEGRKILERRRQQRGKVPDKVVKVGNTTVTTSVEEAKLTDAQIIDKYMDENPDAGSFPTTDARERQKARMSEYRKGRAVGATGDADMQDDGITESRRQSRAWATASAAAAGEEKSVNDARMEEKRRREERVSAQTETQTHKNSAALNSAVNRMVSILSESHGVQSNIDKNLTEMNKMFKLRYEKELKEADKKEDQSDQSGWFGNMFGGDKEKEKRLAPWMTSR